ncbi:MAG: aminoglycoside phosphotransferase family protein [Actinomycetota bacterium]|nr:aminoglycoside phosphotransferase family protein [Actinomycetota bacterium]
MSDPLPFVSRPPGDPATAAHAARAAASAWGFGEPQHLRTGMNALFTCSDDVMLRVSHTNAPPEQAAWLMARLRERGVGVPTLLRPEPVDVDGLAVFAIERLHPAGRVDWRQIGAMVRIVHDWPAHEVVGRYPLPHADTFPWWDTHAALAAVDDLLDEQARAGLAAAIDAHGAWLALVTDRVVCHGDVHPGNVLQSAAGPVLLDWDLLCLGPPAWDHGPLMSWAERWGGDPTMYPEFADGYGRSLVGDPLAESLATMRNVIATLMRVRAGRTDPAAAEEAERRLRFWRGDPAAPMWRAQ